MHISFPTSAHPITRVRIQYRDQAICADFDRCHSSFDAPLPDDVDMDEVSILIEYLDNGQVVVDSVLLKEEVVKEDESDEHEDCDQESCSETMTDGKLVDADETESAELSDAKEKIASAVDELVDRLSE